MWLNRYIIRILPECLNGCYSSISVNICLHISPSVGSFSSYLVLRGSGGPLPCSFFTSISLLRRKTSRSFPREPARWRAPLPSCRHTHTHQPVHPFIHHCTSTHNSSYFSYFIWDFYTFMCRELNVHIDVNEIWLWHLRAWLCKSVNRSEDWEVKYRPFNIILRCSIHFAHKVER